MHARSQLRLFLARVSQWYGRLRCMPYRDAIRYLMLAMRGRSDPQPFSVLGFDLLLRTGTTDLTVACESLGKELEPAISYFPRDFDGMIVDAGGYIGTSALKMARAFPKAKIFVLEPSEENFALLARNVSTFKNVHPVKAALSNQSGKGVLLDRQTGNWGFTIVTNPVDAPSRTERNDVQTVSVADFFETMGIDEVGLFKVDIEGAEAQLFEGAGDWLARTEMLIIELHDWIVPGVEDRFREVTKGRANIKLPGEKHLSIRRT